MLLLVLALAAADPRVLVLDVEVNGGDASLTASAAKLVTQELERAQRFVVLSGDDMRRVLRLEADRAEAGCDTSSCLEEIAGAMGAQLVVFGEIAMLGGASFLTLNLFDTAAVRSIGRASDVVDAQTLAPVTGRLVRRLVRDYDASRGGLPAGTIPILAGTGGALVGAALFAVGGWQLALLADDRAGHDRLVEDFQRDGDAKLIDEAKTLRRAADEHALYATAAFAAGAIVATAGLVGLGTGVWSAVE